MTMPPDPEAPDPDAADPAQPGDLPSPVFVDPSGRRRRLVQVVGWTLSALSVAYLALFVVSLISSPGLLPLSLPGIGRILPGAGAPAITSAGHRPRRPEDVLRSPTPTSSPTAGQLPGNGNTAPSLTPTPGAPGSARATPTPSPRRTPRTTPSATPAPKGTGSPTAHPTPKGTGSPTAHPTHTRSPHAHGPVRVPTSGSG